MTRLITSLVGAIIVAVAVVGCTGPPQNPSPTASSSEIAIGLTEWTIVTAEVQPAAGEVTLVVTNAGTTRHDLVVTGENGTWATPALEPGEQHYLQIQTSAGESLHLLCTLTGHEAQGMHSTIPVAAEPS